MGWLPAGSWNIFQIDNSTSLGMDESFALGRMLGFGDVLNFFDQVPERTFLFEMDLAPESNVVTNLLLANFFGNGLHFVKMMGIQDEPAGEKVTILRSFLFKPGE